MLIIICRHESMQMGSQGCRPSFKYDTSACSRKLSIDCISARMMTALPSEQALARFLSGTRRRIPSPAHSLDTGLNLRATGMMMFQARNFAQLSPLYPQAAVRTVHDVGKLRPGQQRHGQGHHSLDLAQLFILCLFIYCIIHGITENELPTKH